MHQSFDDPAPRYRFRFRGNNRRFEWTHWDWMKVACPNVGKSYTMAESQGCDLCGFCPPQSNRTEVPQYGVRA